MNEPEKRKFKRIPSTVDLSRFIVGSVGEPLCAGRVVNGSPGGLYFQTEAGIFELANLVKIDLSIPPTLGLLESGGKISGRAKVLRTRSLTDSSSCIDLHAGGFGVALEFCQPLQLRI